MRKVKKGNPLLVSFGGAMDPQAAGIAMMALIMAAMVVYFLYVREGW